MSKLTDTLREQHNDSLVRLVQAYSWDRGICPMCESTSIKETSYHETVGEYGYKCRDCGAKGFGQWGEDSHPTLAQIEQYERMQRSRTIYACVVKQESQRKLTFVERAKLLLTRDGR